MRCQNILTLHRAEPREVTCKRDAAAGSIFCLPCQAAINSVLAEGMVNLMRKSSESAGKLGRKAVLDAERSRVPHPE
jgi:hypothetical protein